MTFVEDAKRIAALAWPVLVGQIATVAFGVIDTAMIGRLSPDDVAALAIGGALYISVFVGLMGVPNAVGPSVGQLFGAGRYEDAGADLKQAFWLAGLMSIVGSVALLFPAPWIALSGASPEIGDSVEAYLRGLAFALPASLAFAALRAFNNAVSRPKVVMTIQIAALALKVPLNAMLVFGGEFGPLRWPRLGSAGCAYSTAVVMWLSLVVAFVVFKRDPFYARFATPSRGASRPVWSRQRRLLKLGVPMGLSYLLEVTAFSFMAVFIARLGNLSVAAHQIVANMVTVMFMLPLSQAVAIGVLVAQSIGAGRLREARRVGFHGLRLALMIAIVLSASVYLGRAWLVRAYTSDRRIAEVAVQLVAWVALFHLGDTVQTLAAFILRAYKMAVIPTLVYAVALWGVGIGGGYWIAFGTTEALARLRGPAGFWCASVIGFGLAAVALLVVLDRGTRPSRAN